VQIDLRVLGHPVRVTTQDAAVGTAIGLFWEPAKVDAETSPDAKKRRLDYVFEAGRLYFRGEIVGRAESDVELLAAFERHLLDTLVALGRETCMLHAGAVVVGQDLFLLLGPSGAGKSTFTRLLVQEGGAYLSDDLLSSNGEWLDGAARSIQFDALTGGLVPAHFAGYELVDYPTPGFPAGALSVPIHRGKYVGAGPVRTTDKRVILLCLEHGPDGSEDVLRTLPALERLAWLHAATLVGGKSYSGGLDHGLAFSLVWRDPRRALDVVLDSSRG
jgi:hypothetical protein